MRHSMTILAAAVASVAMTCGASHAQTPNDMVRQYGYQFCAIIAHDFSGGRRCDYTTMEQCRSFASGMGYCLENPAYIAARDNARALPAAPASRKRR